jgi:poly-gamma-glutamate synthesis protein (capsule biosynthesis protein)
MKIGFLGDICVIKSDISDNKHQEVLDDYSASGILPLLKKNDLNIGNLECPVPGAASGILKSGPNMRGSELVIDILKQTGVDMVTLDNNHINDFGKIGIRETQQRCASRDIVTMGPSNALTEEENVQIIEGKKKIAVLTVAENEFNTVDAENKLDRSRDPYHIVSQIIRLRKKADYLLVISHGGNEGYRNPNPLTRNRYRAFADLGVDVVIGHHTHCVQGMEKYGNTLIFYSLGNFFFPFSSNTEDARTGYSLILDLQEDKKEIGYEIVPYRQCQSNYRVDPLEGEQRKEFQKEFDELSGIIKDDKRIHDEWMLYLERYKNFYMKSAYPINIWPYRILKKLGLLQLFFPKRYMVLMLDLIRNESHRGNFAQTLVRYLYK